VSPRFSRRPSGHEKLPRSERATFRWATAVLLAILADGAVRKWLLPPSLQAIPYLAKDFLAACFVAAYSLRRQSFWARRLMPFAAGIGLCLAPAFLVGLTKVSAGALVVFKNAVLWPVFAVRMAENLTEAVIERLWKVVLLSAVVMAALGIAQYSAGQDSVLNRYAWDTSRSSDVALAGSFVRATGTFSYLSGLTAFSEVAFCLFLGRGLSAKRRSGLWLALAGMASAITCGLVTGSRAPHVFIAAVTIIVLLTLPKKINPRFFGGIIGMSVLFAALWYSSLARGVAPRWSDTGEGEIWARVTGSSTGNPILPALLADPIGSGLGLHSGIAAYEQPNAGLPTDESFFSRISGEAGILGWAAFAFELSLLSIALRYALRAEHKYKVLALPIAIGALAQAGLGLWYDHAATGLWWWAIAICLGGLRGKNATKLFVRQGCRLPAGAVLRA
jgi:hypothetical protein